MKWRARARRRARLAALRLLFPHINTEDAETEHIYIALPMPAALMEQCPPPLRQPLCDLAYDRAGREAARLVRNRVGSSVKLGRATLGVS